jgi:hypothetical protein
MTDSDIEPESRNETASWWEWLGPPWSLRIVWGLLPVGLTLIGFGLIPLRSWDYWWHVTIGRLVSRWRAVPTANHYLYTIEAETPSLLASWLAEWLLYEFHLPASVYGTLTLRNLLAACAVAGLTVAAVRRAGDVMAGSLATLAGLVFVLGLVEVRPHLLAWPIFLGLIGVGYRVRAGDWPLWSLAAYPLGAALWANLHGSFFLAAAVALAFAAAETLDRWRHPEGVDTTRERAGYAIVVASLVAPLLNPRGLDLYRYVLSQTTDAVVRSTITEWWPTTPMHPPVLGLLFYATLAGWGYLAWRRWSSVDSADVLLTGGIALLAISQARALLWYGWLLPIVAAPRLGEVVSSADESEPSSPGRLAQGLHVAMAVGLIAVGIAVQPTWKWRIEWTARSRAFEVRSEPPFEGVVPEETPVEPMQLLRRQGIRQRLYHDHRFAGFLLFHLTDAEPLQRVFVDHRVELPPSSVWETYHAINRGEAPWRETFQTHDVGAAVLSFRHQRPLIESLRKDPDWRQTFASDDYALLLRWDDPRDGR